MTTLRVRDETEDHSTFNVLTNKTKIQPPLSWVAPSSHYLKAMGNPWYKLIFKLQSVINYYTFLFFQAKDMCSASFPLTTGSISSPMGLGSDSLPVQINIANQPTFLADSMQFMLEYALRFHEQGVFYIMPSFRGEEADSRHLCQFYHSEAEICGTLDDVISLVESYIKYLAESILNMCRCSLEMAGFNVEHIVKITNMHVFPRISFEDALHALNNNPVYIVEHPAGFKSINNKGESELIKLFNGPVWLTHLPQLAVPFYQADQENTEFSKCADLLLGIGETVGAGERHADPVSVLKAMDKRQVSAKPYEWYLKMREVHPLKTSGFGMGIERFILWILEHTDVRDCQIVPRFNGVDFTP